ncbi:PDZ domain-containing protein [Fictibacillus sp. WQ 8-8]|uniref:SepM family pheromone-processing serine protease n=1 Tax=unclassified Fictibacillus TaxID=2644029 RepID=UPI0006A7AC08|nr:MULTISPECIES: SepM family pheromone-processing serine protease [unclassified Fictibacillus]MCQ6265678.1 PDZ domain-containing protein [Fictibacillus sp. WQ 8-8]UZJ77272.1 PDZ domain-containing protein [Fictibacillus sp. KU28468]SFE11520.1 PDZ domain-containing protein [Bacillus sp. OV194]
MKDHQNPRRSSRISKLSLLGVIVLALVIALYPLPYYVTSPGSANELAPIIHVKDGDKEKGSFMLTTVRIGKANIPQYLYAKVSDYRELLPANEVRSDDETDEEYNQRQLQMMQDSQHAATVVAYRKAGKNVKIISKGVYVTGIISGMPAEGKLKVGDEITELEGKPVKTTEELLKKLAGKKAGDKVQLKVLRGKKTFAKTVALAKFPKKLSQNNEKRAGIGITYPVTDVEIKVDPPIYIKTSEIGGPSAGLMFSLEILNQLTKGDMTKGHKIAGTGTININEEVGPIGGIQQKIVAADKAGAEIFFAPVSANNYKDAVKAAKDIKTDMKIIPVKKMDDAINYLNKLK